MQDFDKVGGASGREGFRRIIAKSEKLERPGRLVVASLDEEEGLEDQGVASACSDIIISMLASPQGASVEKRCIVMWGDRRKGWALGVWGYLGFRRMNGEVVGRSAVRRCWISEKRRWLRALRARISEWESWRMRPWARGRVEEGMHLEPVARVARWRVGEGVESISSISIDV